MPIIRISPWPIDRARVEGGRSYMLFVNCVSAIIGKVACNVSYVSQGTSAGRVGRGYSGFDHYYDQGGYGLMLDEIDFENY